MKMKDDIYDRDKGIKAIICLQAISGIHESLEKATRGWDSMSESEKANTTSAHKVVCAGSFEPIPIDPPKKRAPLKSAPELKFKAGLSESKQIFKLIEAAIENAEIRDQAHHFFNSKDEKWQKLKAEWEPLWKHPDGPGYYCRDKGLKLEDVDLSSDIATAKIKGRVIKIERRRRMKGPTDICWGWHTGWLGYSFNLDGIADSTGDLMGWDGKPWGWKHKIDLARAIHKALGVELVEKERKPTPWKPNHTHRFWAEPLYLYIRNEAPIYHQQVVPLIKKMESLLAEGKYGFEEGKENLLSEFQQIAQQAVWKFARECESHWYTQVRINRNSVGIGRVCGQELEEYWRTEAALQLKNGFSAVG